MSHSVRRPLGSKAKKSSWRRAFLIFAILLFLFLLGTVIVLSSVSYWFGVPKTAFVTEKEVPWDPSDAIPRLLDEPQPGSDLEWATPDALADSELDDALTAVRRSDDAFTENFEDEAGASGGASAVLSDDDSLHVGTYTPPQSIEETIPESEEDVWGINGKGSGAYWMRKDWDGHVQETKSWDRLYNVTLREGEKIPRIIHQTWKSDVLPEKWRTAWRECREGMPDYEYMLWTDDMSRDFIATHYPAQLHMFDTYPYPIQRADAIRYFILHHFGGIYMDLDIGCRRRIDPLLQPDWDVVLPITKPVGVSNDLILATPRSAFMEQTVHGLAAFNHHYFLHYPTVMFSTGPMFLSAQLSIYSGAHPVTPSNPTQAVRVLPKSLYGKNAPQDEVPHSFFSHFYGSSWHANDAGFITWLGKWGKGLMYVGAVVLVFAVLRLLYTKGKARFLNSSPQYQLLPVGMPYEDGRESPTSLFGSGPPSPLSDAPPAIGDALRRAGNLILAAPAALASGSGRRQRGWLYFVPAIFLPSPSTSRRRRTASEASQLPRDSSYGYTSLFEHPAPAPRVSAPPPPYESGAVVGDSAMAEVDAFLKRESRSEKKGGGLDVNVVDVRDDTGESSTSSSVPLSPGASSRGDWDEEEGKWEDWRQC